MSNPYEILGIPSSASMEQVKEAYKRLAAKYQADEYAGSPLAEHAAKKMDEINQAYDTILFSRENSRHYNNSSNTSNANYSQYSSDFSDIRRKINEGRIDDAEIRLDGISPTQRNAEWYFLKGSVNHRRGWFEEAKKNFTIACQMEPSNNEYRSAFNSMSHNHTTGGYRTRQRNTHSSRKNDGICDICGTLICADCCCECLGGDLIPCC